MCYRKFKCRVKVVVPHSAHITPANISNSIQASKVNRIYFKWVKYLFFSNVLSLALQAVSLLGFCLSKSPAPFTLVGKASALTCGSLIPKMCETTLSMKQKMQAHIWRHLRRRWSGISRDRFPSQCAWMISALGWQGGDHRHLSKLGRWWKTLTSGKCFSRA